MLLNAFIRKTIAMDKDINQQLCGAGFVLPHSEIKPLILVFKLITKILAEANILNKHGAFFF